jgi:hypothetical protein
LTAEQLEAARAERMRQDGCGTLTLEDARTWIEETGLCLFLPRRQFSATIAPSFVEAMLGRSELNPAPAQVSEAEGMLVRLETAGVAVRLNLLGHPGEMPDFVVASWVLPYVYALRGDRDWRRSPQLTGSRQVSPLAVQAYKLLEAADTTVTELTHTLGREVTETAVLRAITELWQQLRIIPVIAAAGEPAKWQLLRQRFQKAIAEGASTSQVTAISVLASIYLQAVIAATMEDVEIFLSPLTARSKVREVLRGLMATRQVHTIALGHSPHYYVAGTLPVFPVAPTIYASTSMPASAYFMHPYEDELPESAEADEVLEAPELEPVLMAQESATVVAEAEPESPAILQAVAPEPEVMKPVSNEKSTAARPHFSRSVVSARDRKPASSPNGRYSARRPASDSRPAPMGKSGSMRPIAGKPVSGPCNGNKSEPVLSASAKANNSVRYGFVARPKQNSKKTR